MKNERRKGLRHQSSSTVGNIGAFMIWFSFGMATGLRTLTLLSAEFGDDFVTLPYD